MPFTSNRRTNLLLISGALTAALTAAVIGPGLQAHPTEADILRQQANDKTEALQAARWNANVVVGRMNVNGLNRKDCADLISIREGMGQDAEAIRSAHATLQLSGHLTEAARRDAEVEVDEALDQRTPYNQRTAECLARGLV